MDMGTFTIYGKQWNTENNGIEITTNTLANLQVYLLTQSNVDHLVLDVNKYLQAGVRYTAQV